MQNVNKGLFDQVLRELKVTTYCVYATSERIAESGHPGMLEMTWSGYWFDTRGGKDVEVHAFDKNEGACCECEDSFGDDDEYCSKEREILVYDEERPVIQPQPSPKTTAAVFPSFADAVGYRPPPPKIYQAHEWELCSLSDYEEERDEGEQ